MAEIPPKYGEAIKIGNSQKVLHALCNHDGIAKFSMLEKDTQIRAGLLLHHLNRLASLGVIESEVKGTYRLRFRTPLCYAFGARKTQFVYVGLLGRRDSYTTPEPEVALSLLANQKIVPVLKYVMTSPEALADWKNEKLRYQWILCYGEEIIDIDEVQKKLIPQLTPLLRQYMVVMDCTSSTKPATIAYYELAQRFLIPCIYVSEEKKTVRWLISRETIKQKLGLQ
jgi:hypothetical protein